MTWLIRYTRFWVLVTSILQVGSNRTRHGHCAVPRLDTSQLACGHTRPWVLYSIEHVRSARLASAYFAYFGSRFRRVCSVGTLPCSSPLSHLGHSVYVLATPGIFFVLAFFFVRISVLSKSFTPIMLISFTIASSHASVSLRDILSLYNCGSTNRFASLVYSCSGTVLSAFSAVWDFLSSH